MSPPPPAKFRELRATMLAWVFIHIWRVNGESAIGQRFLIPLSAMARNKIKNGGLRYSALTVVNFLPIGQMSPNEKLNVSSSNLPAR